MDVEENRLGESQFYYILGKSLSLFLIFSFNSNFQLKLMRIYSNPGLI